MKPLDAAYHVVHDYPGGAAALAPRLGKASVTLCHEVKPPSGSMAKFGLTDAVKVSDLADDFRILHSFAQALHHQAVRYEIPECDTAEDVHACAAHFTREVAEALLAVNQALTDGRITPNEIHRIEKEVADIAPAAVSLVARMRALVAQRSKLRAVGQAA